MPSAAPTRPTHDSAELRRLCERSDRRGCEQLLIHLAALAATTLLLSLSQHTALLVPAMALHGVVLVFLFAPLHECIHRTAFRSRFLNTVVAWVAGFVLCLPPKYFRAFHLTHHRFTQQRERDPELACPKPATRAAWLWQVTGGPYWHERISTLLRHALGRVDECFIGGASRRAIVAEARALLLLYAGVAVVSWWVPTTVALVFWVVPVLLGQPALRLFLMAEHTGCPLVPDMLANSRTTHTHPLVRRLAWNMSYHAEHHWHPGLPFHALAKAHAQLGAFIGVQEKGYYRFHRELLGAYRAARAERGGPAAPFAQQDDSTR